MRGHPWDLRYSLCSLTGPAKPGDRRPENTWKLEAVLFHENKFKASTRKLADSLAIHKLDTELTFENQCASL